MTNQIKEQASLNTINWTMLLLETDNETEHWIKKKDLPSILATLKHNKADCFHLRMLQLLLFFLKRLCHQDLLLMWT